MQYYNADGSTNPIASFNGYKSGGDTTQCGSGKNLYLTSTNVPASFCTRSGADPNDWTDGTFCLLTWQDALNYCSSLGAGWQLPSADELNSICKPGGPWWGAESCTNFSNYGTNGSSLNGLTLWTSTEWNSSNAWAYQVGTYSGGAMQKYNLGQSSDLNSPEGVRCVKTQ